MMDAMDVFMTDVEFQSAVAHAVVELGSEAVAAALLVSLPTVRRWVEGKNLPHQTMRKSIMRYVHGDC